MIKLYINCAEIKLLKILPWILGMFCFFSASAQQSTGAVKGKIIETENIAIVDVTVSLLKSNDSSLVKMALTNEQGIFELKNIKPGAYFLGITYIGYTTEMRAINIGPGAIADAGTIELKKGKNLGQVNIIANTPYVDVKPGKTVVNVDKSILSAGGTALDVLGTAPGVQVDGSGNVTLNGKDVQIMINGRQSYLSPADLADLLRNTPSNTIAQLELIANPGAGQSAEGSGGIINIKQRRDKTAGFTASVNETYGIADIPQYGTKQKWNTGFNFDYNTKNTSWYGGFTHANNLFDRLSIIDRTVFDPGIQQVHTEFLDDLHDSANTFRLGMDYTINPKQLIGFLVNGSYSNYDYHKGTTSNISNNGMADSSIITQSAVLRRLVNYTVDIDYKNDLGNLGTLSADVDYTLFDRKPTENIISNYYNGNNALFKTLLLQNIFPTIYHIYTATVADDIKTGKNSWLQAQAKVSYVATDNSATFGNVVNSQLIPDPAFTSGFNFREQINAFGLTYNTALNKSITLNAGLRTEQTINTGTATPLSGGQQVYKNNYIDFFPSLLITNQVNADNQLSFSYDRRIRRPAYVDLNPFISYQDQFNYFEGNPALKPQYTNTIELKDIYRQKFSFSLQASVINDFIFSTYLPGNIIKMNGNIGNCYSYNAIFIAPIDLTKWWNANINLDASYVQYDNSIAGNTFNVNSQDVTLGIRQQFTFLKQFKAELYSVYETPHYYAYNYSAATYHFDAGISKSILKSQGSLQLQVYDIFNTNYTNYTSNYQNLNFSGHLQIFFRTYQLNFIYSLGKKGKAERQHKIGSADEQGRSGG